MAHPLFAPSILFLGGLVLVWKFVRFIAPSEADYMNIFTHEWKSGEVARAELCKRHDETLYKFVFHRMMKKLVEEDMLECRPISTFPDNIVDDFEYKRKFNFTGLPRKKPTTPCRQLPLPTSRNKTARVMRPRRSFLFSYYFLL